MVPLKRRLGAFSFCVVVGGSRVARRVRNVQTRKIPDTSIKRKNERTSINKRGSVNKRMTWRFGSDIPDRVYSLRIRQRRDKRKRKRKKRLRRPTVGMSVRKNEEG